MDSPWVAIEQKGRTFTIPAASVKTLNEKLLKSQSAYFKGTRPDPMLRSNGPTEAWGAMDEDTKAHLLKLAAKVISTARDKSVSDAVNVIEAEKLGSDEKSALWSQFDAQLRRSITAEINSRKAA
jgi:hypothetical protein